MTPVAITFLVLSIIVVWGGFVASVVYLKVHPGREEYPPGGEQDDAANSPSP